MELAGLVVAGVSALGTLIQAFYAARAKHKDVPPNVIARAKKRGQTPLKTGTKTVANVIDSTLLATLSHRVETCHLALVQVLSNTQLSHQEQAQQVEIARQEVCSILITIKQFNNDQLPTKRLQELWESNRCNHAS